jgi:hypothetical protein
MRRREFTNLLGCAAAFFNSIDPFQKWSVNCSPEDGSGGGLLSSRPSQRLIDPVLPAGAGFLEVFKHVLIYAQ